MQKSDLGLEAAGRRRGHLLVKNAGRMAALSENSNPKYKE